MVAAEISEQKGPDAAEAYAALAREIERKLLARDDGERDLAYLLDALWIERLEVGSAAAPAIAAGEREWFFRSLPASLSLVHRFAKDGSPSLSEALERLRGIVGVSA